MIKKISLFLLMVCAVFLTSCTKEAPVDALTIGATKFVFNNQGAAQEIVFDSNVDWTIESDAEWITFDKKKGPAGANTIKMTVAENTGYDARTAKVSLKAGGKTTVFTVEQSNVNKFGSSIVYEISAKDQEIQVNVKANVEYDVKVAEDAVEWITVLSTKAVPAEGTIKLNVSANSGIEPRKGHFTISAGNYSQTYEVVQNAEYILTATAEAFYLKNRQKIFDSEQYAYTTFHQFAVLLKSEDGDKVTLVVNSDNIEAKTTIPSGTYAVDASATHTDKTFSIKSTNGHEEYYTSLVIAGKENNIVDGEIVIGNENGKYTITAVLVDALENQHRYSYVGEITVKDDSFGALIEGNPTFRGVYNTYFTTKANEWSITLFVSAAAKAGEPYMSYLTFTLYSPAGEVNNQEFPVGTFNWAPTTVDETSTYANGITVAQPNTYTMYANDIELVGIVHQEGKPGTLVISKNDDGSYKFVYNASLVRRKEIYDDAGNVTSVEETPFEYSAVYDRMIVDNINATGMEPVLDGDAEFNSIMNSKYVALWFGDVFSTSCNVFTIGFSSVNNVYDLYITINVSGEWQYIKNFNNRFCNTPFKQGTFTFSPTAAAAAILPVKFGSNPYSYVKNGYTGTKYIISGGSVTLDGSKIIYNNLEAKAPDGSVYRFTGEHPATMYFAQDLSKKATYLKFIE